MTEASTHESSEVVFRLYDFTTGPEGFDDHMEPGWYYDIPENGDDAAPIYPAGPYPTSDEAMAAAKAFIQDAVVDHTAEANNDSGQ